jgi:hypothetical protein
MADLKISQLSAATALAGTEVVPVVQGGSTKKATIDQILTPAVGKGVDYSANTPAAGMTSQLLDDYEEGTWTPTVTPASGGTITSYTASGTYTKTGRQVIANFKISITNAGTGVGAATFTLPFASGAHPEGMHGCGREDGATGFQLQVWGYASQSTANIAIFNNNGTIVTGYVLTGTFAYFV